MVPYLLLVFLLTLPFWMLDWLTGIALMPGLPISGLATFVPAIAAIVVVFATERGAGVGRLLSVSLGLRGRAGSLSLAIAILALPALTVLGWGLGGLLGRPPATIVLGASDGALLLVLFLLGAVGDCLLYTSPSPRDS